MAGLSKRKENSKYPVRRMKGRMHMKLSLVPLLITGQSVSPEIRQALRENRFKDAAQLLMQLYGLSCIEAGQLLDVGACDR
jgi:FAD synthase